MVKKAFIEVHAVFSPDGALMPEFLIWDNGKRYEIDKVIDIRKAASLKVGGCGIRYTCRILGKMTYLFLEDGRWFVEGK